jgi:hypothetical protein
MKSLSTFIKDESVKVNVDKFFENHICIDTIELADQMALKMSYGSYANFVFENSYIKNYFIDRLQTYCQDLNIINCNCTLDSFFENQFNGFLVFNNLKRCQHKEIIEEIKKHKAILLC